MESNLHLTGSYCIDYCAQRAQLGILDNFNRNSFIHEERLALQHQAERALIRSALLRNAGDEFDFESSRRLVE